jgi:hypothetical protein
MLRLHILLSGLLVTPAADTVWWHTNGGSVIEQRTADSASCTLTVNNSEGRFAFIWDRQMPTRVMVTRQDWALPPDQITSVALRLGDVWLADGDGAPNIAAMTGTSAVMFILNQPIDDLLSSANEIVVRTPNARFGITLIRGKMTALMTALHRCRAAIGG